MADWGMTDRHALHLGSRVDAWQKDGATAFPDMAPPARADQGRPLRTRGVARLVIVTFTILFEHGRRIEIATEDSAPWTRALSTNASVGWCAVAAPAEGKTAPRSPRSAWPQPCMVIRSVRIRSFKRTSPGWRIGYSSTPRYFLARWSIWASASSVVIATTVPRTITTL